MDRLTIAALALLASVAAAVGQTVREIPGPREVPPESFRGAQYVDSGGCVFVRAGLDGRTIWVPRVNAQRKVLCGYPPTLVAGSGGTSVTPKAVAPVAAPAAPKPAAKAPKPASVTEATQRTAQTDDYIDAPRAGRTPGALRCPARAPIAERVPLATGGSILLCVSRPGLVAAATALPAAAQTATTAALVATASKAGRPAPLALTLTEPRGGIDLVKPVVPKGYKLAWKDDRLNPNRARGTARGQAQQDLVWTRDTPARLVTRADRAKPQPEATALQISTKGSSGKARYVQIGAFADPANARAAEARLSRIGLPAATGRMTRGGQPLQVVMAGPFIAEADARAALSAVQRAGFADALLR